MSPIFESVLSQAEKLSKKEKAKLINILAEPASPKARNGKKPKISAADKTSEDDAAWIAALRAKIDKIVKHENPKPNSAAKIADRIRKWNDRGYKL